MSATFVWKTCALPDVKHPSTKTYTNSIHIVDGEFVGLHFGEMKNFARAKERLIKQFNLGPDGCTSFQHDGYIHLSEPEYKAFWGCMNALVRELIETGVVKDQEIFTVTKSERKAQKKLFEQYAGHHGVSVKTQLQRIIFRNAYPEKGSDAFINVVMGHKEEADLRSYYKPDLVPAALANLLPRRDED